MNDEYIKKLMTQFNLAGVQYSPVRGWKFFPPVGQTIQELFFAHLSPRFTKVLEELGQKSILYSLSPSMVFTKEIF